MAYVVAEVRLSPYYKLAQCIPEFQATVRSRFPRTREANVLRIDLLASDLKPEAEKAWRFFTENQRMAIDLSPRVLSLHATEYGNFDDFSDTLRNVLEAAQANVPDLYVEQLGLRYIDYLLPEGDSSGVDYVVEAVRGFTPPGAGAPTQAYWIASFPMAVGHINVRILPKLPAGTAQPPNFGPIEELAPSAMQLEAIQRAQRNESVGCVDTDRIMPVGKKFQAEELIQLFTAMHGDVSRTFKASISQKARELWI